VTFFLYITEQLNLPISCFTPSKQAIKQAKKKKKEEKKSQATCVISILFDDDIQPEKKWTA